MVVLGRRAQIMRLLLLTGLADWVVTIRNQDWFEPRKNRCLYTYIHTFPERIAEASQIFLRDAHVLPKLFSYE
jgi:hypothetical protein